MNHMLEDLMKNHRRLFVGVGLLILSAVVASVMRFTWGGLPSGVSVGHVARQDLRADKDYEITDEEATEQLRQEARDKVENEARKDVMGPYDEDAIKKLQEEAAEAVEPVKIRILAGQSIIRSGDRFESWHVKVIEGIRREKDKALGRVRLLGTFFFVFFLLAAFFYVLNRSFRRVELLPKDLLFMGCLLVMTVLVERLSLFVFGGIQGLLPIEIPIDSFYALVPLAFGTMIVRLVLPLPMALVFAPVSASLAGILAQGNLQVALYYFVGSVLCIPLMNQVRTRGRLFRVGLQLGAANALVLFALDLIDMTSVFGMADAATLLLRSCLALLGGILSAAMVLILSPIFESLFNYLTPIKLLEYGSQNHPLLREMIVRAPGTYHHSHMVGTLAESAAEAIGADALFTRVASYFHDIGKMKKAAYFIENQSAAGGEDRHAALAPSMSALIISSHVKDGIELAREHKLPQRIIDIIPQHQGTKLITYFYNKAKEREDPEMHVAAERDYRYPGPKPQTREAGVILLADTTEAATRALKDRSPARLEEVVRNMINKNFIDGQLDECELTLKDLHTIAKSFLRVLMGIYHQRVEYPPDEADKAARAPSGRAEDENDADKYSQSKPLREDALKEVAKLPSKNIPRIGGSRSGD